MPSNLLVFAKEGTYLSLDLKRLKPPPQTTLQPPKLGRESVFLHCCFGHHAVVVEGCLFVVFCVVDVIVQMIALRLSTACY